MSFSFAWETIWWLTGKEGDDGANEDGDGDAAEGVEGVGEEVEGEHIWAARRKREIRRDEGRLNIEQKIKRNKRPTKN